MSVHSEGLHIFVSSIKHALEGLTSFCIFHQRTLEGHLFDVYTCRLFPSGVVVLSGGGDMQLRIWDAATGSCPVVLKGHTAAVLDTAIVDRGKNIVSVSK